MTFAYPYLLYLLIIPALLPVCAYLVRRIRSRKWEQLVAPKLRSELVIPPSHTRQLISLITGLLGLALIIVALARPQWGEKEVQEVYRGRNIIIAFDISRSMLTKDVLPSRMEQARTAAYDLLDALPEDKFGLIVFSGEASLILPLTHDHAAVKETLEQVNYGWIGYGGTDFNSVLQNALKAFDKKEGAKALVILSDGENTESLDTLLIEESKKQQIIIVAAGIGTATGDSIPAPKNQDGLYRDRQGKIILSKFNPESLKNLATKTNGDFLHLISPSQLNNLIQNVGTRLDQQESSTGTRKIPEEHYAPFLGGGLFLLMLSLLLSAGWSRGLTRPTASFLLFLMTALPLHAEGEGENEETSRATNEDVFLNAENELAKRIGEDNIPRETNALLAFKNGYQAIKEKKWDKAVESFSRSMLTDNHRLRSESHYNIANVLAEKELEKLRSDEDREKLFKDEKALEGMKKSLSEAISHYDDSLKANPGNENAKANRNALENIIKKLIYNPPPPQDQNQQQQQDNKDQQNQDKNDQKDQNQQDKNQQDKNDQQKNQSDQQQNNPDKSKQDKENQQQGGDSQDNKRENDNDQNPPEDNPDQKENQDKKDDQNDAQKGEEDKQKNQGDNPEKQDNEEGEGDRKEDQNGEKEEPSSPTPQNPGEQGNDQNGKPHGIGSEKEEQNAKLSPEEAAKILKDRSDMEKGSPFPVRGINNQPGKDW